MNKVLINSVGHHPAIITTRKTELRMRVVRSFIPFCMGFGLLYLVLIELRGFLAARQVPVGYFSFFGKEHQELALFLSKLVLHLVPESLALTGGVVVCTRAPRGCRSANARMVALGAVASYCFWLLFHHVTGQAQHTGAPGVDWAGLGRQFHAPWWALPTLLSPLVGLAMGTWLATRKRKSDRSHGGHTGAL